MPDSSSAPLVDTPTRAGAAVDFAEISRTLWRERELLDVLLFKLHEQHLLLVTGSVEWLARASSEVETVLERIGHVELERAVEFEAVAADLGLPPGPSLRELAAKAPDPWGFLLGEHHNAFLVLAERIQNAAEANRELTAAAASATDAVLASLAGADTKVAAYGATGRRDVDVRRPVLVDREV
jgi:hypothetical protein